MKRLTRTGMSLAPLAQRREIDVQDIEPVIQIVPEFPQCYELLEAPVGGGEHPNVYLDRLNASHPKECPRLQHPQQLHLHGGRDLADLVEEDGASVGQLEATQPALRRTGEGALFVAEQLRLKQGLG